MKAARPQPCPWGQPLGCHKDGARNVPPKLLRAEHRVKQLSPRAASFRQAHLPGSGWSCHPTIRLLELGPHPCTPSLALACLHSCPGGLRLLYPDDAQESHHSRVCIQQCMCIPLQAYCISPPLQHSELATGFGGR